MPPMKGPSQSGTGKQEGTKISRKRERLDPTGFDMVEGPGKPPKASHVGARAIALGGALAHNIQTCRRCATSGQWGIEYTRELPITGSLHPAR